MVEGPCCALFAERLRARVRRGQAVRSARGSALPAGARAAVRNRASARILGCAWCWVPPGWGRAFRDALVCFGSDLAGACEPLRWGNGLGYSLALIRGVVGVVCNTCLRFAARGCVYFHHKCAGYPRIDGWGAPRHVYISFGVDKAGYENL